ncbi:hypothetical protein Tco_1066593 [Tanacetum coccineum]|uniref:Uncharacterized protein n=1 Tax=Tanacetum coccineum TaxID=301880 RepID=A0ABQ5HAH0_9ASTR
MMEADRLLYERLQSKEREELTDEEKAKLFMELMEKRKKHFAALRAQEKRNRPPTKAQKRTQMSTYLKHMAMGSEIQESKEKKEEGREETTKGITEILIALPPRFGGVISEFDCTQKFINEIGELRAISSHMLGAAGVQIPKNNLDDLHSSREEDGTSETMDP